jgi:hypothetical protein
MMYRQGDVLIESVPSIEGQMVTRKGRIVLAEGEMTGHAHAIHETDVELYERDGTLFLHVPTEAHVVHEEHGTITLPGGDYRVTRQREYSPEAIRVVGD